MTLDLDDFVVVGSAMTTPFLLDGLDQALALSDIPEPGWDTLRGSLRTGGWERVHRSVTAALAGALGYSRPLRQRNVMTREGQEDAGWLVQGPADVRLRVWSIAGDVDLDGLDRSPRARRSSPTRIAQRVLLAVNEPAGLITNGELLRLLLCDPSRADSSLSVSIRDWKNRPLPPDSFRVLLALAGATGLPRLPGVLHAARLHQVRVTTKLRHQAKDAITGFINALPDRPGRDPAALWREGLILVYRLLLILKLESSAEAGSGFSFASVRLWQSALSPTKVLAPVVRRHLDQGHDTGQLLQAGLRLLFTVFRDGLSCSELRIAPLGGALFGTNTTPLLDSFEWGERAVAILLDRLIWVPSADRQRNRVHYGLLDVEDLGSIYEGLLEQEPAIANEPLVRVRRGKLETVRPAGLQPPDIVPGAFYLRSGRGRKATGSFYTPHEFVRFLVRETLDPRIEALSPLDDPHPARLLALRIVDPAIGSGHFLVEACRHLGEALLTACRICDDRGLHDRIAALPDLDNTVASYLPSRGFSEATARAICRRLVAVHCLYGCDSNKLAVELTKLSLWLESYAEGLPLTFLDHRLVHGDALTGPFFKSLETLPVTGGPLDPLLALGIVERLTASRRRAQTLVEQLNASIGRDVDDLVCKQAAKEELDRVLYPLRQLARAWSGAAMMRDRAGDDVWLGLAAMVAECGRWPEVLTTRQSVLLAAGSEAVAWDLVFPEVFPSGFSVVLGNPPWDVVLPNTKDFVADYDPSVLDAKTRTERTAIEQAVLSRPGVAAAFDAYRSGFERLKHIASRLYVYQRVAAGGTSTAGNLDLFRLFAERNMDLAAPDGSIGVLLPSAFHSNEGTTGVRRLYLQAAKLAWCLSFENRRRIFDIDSRFKFDLIVARRPGPTRSLRCGFYLSCIEDVGDPEKIMHFSVDFLDQVGGVGLAPPELRGNMDLQLAKMFFGNEKRLQTWCLERGIRFGCDLHMTADAGCFISPDSEGLKLHEGKTFHQYTDTWHASPRYSVPFGSLKQQLAEATSHYRLAFRDIARSNDERTMIACIAPPNVVFGHTATVEKSPSARTVADALILCALFNSFPFDWLVRQKASNHLSLYILDTLPVPAFSDSSAQFLTQGALRLSCNHIGFAALCGGEAKLPNLWDQRARWDLRAQMDAVVARSYGLDRKQYEHLLSSFTQRSFPAARALCLDAFDASTVRPTTHRPSHQDEKIGLHSHNFRPI